jgi:hypothetical protein
MSVVLRSTTKRCVYQDIVASMADFILSEEKLQIADAYGTEAAVLSCASR